MINERYYKKTYVPQVQKLMISSPAFVDHHRIPVKYTADGKNMIPPLKISGIPVSAKSIAITLEDKDSLNKKVYWVIWNLPVKHLLQFKVAKGVIGRNDFKQNLYAGPRHPRGMHRYTFKIFALDEMLNLPAKSGREELINAMCDNIVGVGEITGKYERKRFFDIF